MDIQGHRGCRGLYPENTLIAMKKALELGVTTLEMDLVITKDLQVILSHEPYFNEEITTLPDGNYIHSGEDIKYNIYQMDYSEVIKYDVGLKPHPKFPMQKKIAAVKPLFKEVLDLAYSTNPNILFNIEIKSTPQTDNLYHPSVSQYCELVMDVVLSYPTPEKVTVQSFDYRTLEYLHIHYPSQPLSMLSENQQSLSENLKSINFIPNIYSPDFTQLTKEDIAVARNKKMAVIPWTVNSAADAYLLIQWEVDGIITDFPNLFL
jgi:glycerophosphoryl diester phosphodiesterase